jgi:4-amino-4-deoxy-L-arabinose transferase-like glycosyltransferase
VSDKPQTYANHRARLPRLWLAAGVVLVIDVFRRGWLAWRERDLGVDHWGVHLWYVVLISAVLVVWYESRRRAQIVQDRVIRVEMRVRLVRVLGASRRKDIDRLTSRQLVGLRFASDAELPALVDEVLAGRLTEQDAIKKRVKDWQADWLRV